MAADGVGMVHRAPFTVQRICEILDNKGQGYCSVDKLLNALEKVRECCYSPGSGEEKPCKEIRKHYY